MWLFVSVIVAIWWICAHIGALHYEKLFCSTSPEALHEIRTGEQDQIYKSNLKEWMAIIPYLYHLPLCGEGDKEYVL